MKLLRAYITTFLLLLAFLANAQQGNSSLNREVSLVTDTITKANLLDTLGKMYNLHFSYNPELLQAEGKVKIEMNATPLAAILNQLINPAVLGYKALDNQIIFFPIHISKNNSKEVKYKLLTGLVTAGRKENSIPYCNIAIVGKMMGTMSNMDGKFTVKIPEEYWADTLSFSCMGYEPAFVPIEIADENNLIINLLPKTFQLQAIDVFNYDTHRILDSIEANITVNYENNYSLYTTFYRELIKENDQYIDISEAVLEVIKAPYSTTIREDHVKFLKGRKGAESKPFNEITFKLKGGPYYITKLDVVKNYESFINREFRHLYSYEYDRKLLIDGRETIVLSFEPIYNLRDVLFEGELYIDLKTWAIARVEFEYTRQGLKEVRQSLIQKEPKNCRAMPTELAYSVLYKFIDRKWYLLSVQSSMQIKINDKEQKQKTKFHSVSEILTTNIEKGEIEQFSRKEIFKPNEIFTDKIIGYDKSFWENYNVIQPEDQLIDALKSFENQNLTITNLEP